MAQGSIIFTDLLFWLSLCLAPTGSQAVLWLQPHQVPRTRCQQVPSGQDRPRGTGQTPGDRTDPCQGHSSSRVQSSAGSAAPLGAFHAIAPCPLSTKGHQGRLSCSGSAAVRGVILKSLWVGKSLDFISPFQCEFFETFHSDITLRFSTASEFLPINGKNINVHLGK